VSHTDRRFFSEEAEREEDDRRREDERRREEEERRDQEDRAAFEARLRRKDEEERARRRGGQHVEEEHEALDAGMDAGRKAALVGELRVLSEQVYLEKRQEKKLQVMPLDSCLILPARYSARIELRRGGHYGQGGAYLRCVSLKTDSAIYNYFYLQFTIA
jgi:hypothetical protein